MSKKKKLTCTQLERKKEKELENELCRDWEAFRAIVLEDNEKPFKYHKSDVCRHIKNYIETGNPKFPQTIEITNNEFLKAQAERMWNNIISYEKHIQGK